MTKDESPTFSAAALQKAMAELAIATAHVRTRADIDKVLESPLGNRLTSDLAASVPREQIIEDIVGGRTFENTYPALVAGLRETLGEAAQYVDSEDLDNFLRLIARKVSNECEAELKARLAAHHSNHQNGGLEYHL